MVSRSLALVVVSFLLSNTASAQISRVNLSRSFPVLQVGNTLWIGTPAGLYQYSSADDSYKRFVLPGARANPEIRQIFYYKEWLWCVLDTGLAALQVRLNDWLLFDSGNGLPSNEITGIDFQEDYVWVSTPKGLARFDLLIEQWDRYGHERGVPSPSVIDVKVIGSELWIVTDSTISAYNPQFEKWRHFAIDSDSTEHIARTFLLGDELWLVGGRGLIRFNTELQRQQLFHLPYLSQDRLLDIVLEESRMWAITCDGLFIYEQQSGVWREFEGNRTLQEEHITGASISSDQIWIATESNTLIWNRVGRTWEILDYSSGLSGAGYRSLYADGTLALLFRTTDLEYRKSAASPWRLFHFGERGTPSSTQDPLRSLFDNPEGGSLVLPDYKWGWQGTRIAFLQNGTRQFTRDGSPTLWTTTRAEQYDVKSQLDVPGGRRVTGFYNTVDYTETKYGVRVRGNDSDYVREFTWGDFRREQGVSPFTIPTEVFGGSLWLQYGPKTERFKRSLVTVKGTSGESRSRRTYEHFSGAATEFSRTIPDRGYVRNQFFKIPTLGAHSLPEHLEVFVDDASFATNTPGTHLTTTIAGLTGDFDRWRPVEDFYFYEHGTVLRFQRPILPVYRIVVRYTVGGQTSEAVLQDGNSFTTATLNFYSLGAEKIIPYTFLLVLRDSLGHDVPLASIGLDRDGNGTPDDEWIDYQSGILHLPVQQPFPPEVYGLPSGRTLYSFEISGQTEVPLLILQHRNLVRQSEIVRLDGLPAAVGNDYVLDYTNGSLLFVREGVVNPDTRIEIDYEYYEEKTANLTSASFNISPSDFFFTQIEWQRQARDSTDLVSMTGEWRQPLGSFDVRVIPAAQYQPGGSAVTGRSVEGLVSSSWLRLQSKYEDYDREYRNLYHPQSIIGDVARQWQVFSSVDVTEDLRVSGDWKSVAGYNNHGGDTPSDRYGSASLLFHRQDLPGTQLQTAIVKTTTSDTTTDKHYIQNLLEYQLPGAWTSALSMKSVKLEHFVRYGRESRSSFRRFAKDEFLQTYYRLNTIVSDQFQAGFFYRMNEVHDVSIEGTRLPVSSAERLLADFSYGEWRFMQINARLENTLQQYSHRRSARNDYSLRQLYQANVRLSPGEVWGALSSLFFEINHTQAVVQSGISDKAVGEWLWRLSVPSRQGSTAQSVLRSTFIKNEFRPTSRWLVQSLFEWSRQDLGAGLTMLQRRSWRLNEKLDAKIGLSARLVLQYRQSYQDFGYDKASRDYEPSVWLEQRWTPDLMTVAQFLFRRTLEEDVNVAIPTREYQTTLDLVWRKNGFGGMRYIEVRQTVFGSYRKSDYVVPQETVQFSAGSSLDLYPIHSLIMRVRADISYVGDLQMPTRSYTAVSYSAVLSLQL